MAALTITPGLVKYSSGVRPRIVQAGAAIERGEALYFDTTDNKYKLADCDAEATAVAAGVALSDGVDGGDMLIAPDGATINIGATTVAGTVYCVGATPGEIVPLADVTNEDYVTILFIGSGTAVVTLSIVVGAQIPAL